MDNEKIITNIDEINYILSEGIRKDELSKIHFEKDIKPFNYSLAMASGITGKVLEIDAELPRSMYPPTVTDIYTDITIDEVDVFGSKNCIDDKIRFGSGITTGLIVPCVKPAHHSVYVQREKVINGDIQNLDLEIKNKQEYLHLHNMQQLYKYANNGSLKGNCKQGGYVPRNKRKAKIAKTSKIKNRSK